jgi:peptidoglycan hydrolase CwlO-like protein
MFPRAPRAVRFVALGAVLALAVPLVLAVPVATAPSASAQTDPFDAEIAQARAEVEAAQSAAHAAAEKLAATEEQSAAVQARVTEVQAQVADLQIKIPALRAHAEEMRGVLRQRAAALYSSGGPAALYGPLSVVPSMKNARRKILADAAARADDQMVDELEATAAQLDAAEQQLQVEQAALVQQQAELVQLQAQLQAQQGEMDRRVAAANAALERATLLGALRARGEPVMGPTVLSGAQMAAWIHAKGYKPRLQTSIEDLANIYVEEGNDEGLRGDLAFAQSVIETGGFAASPDNNYAGMGWCDSCSQGTRFPTPRDAVRAQVQHLKNYADSTSRASGLSHPPSPYWYSADPVVAARKFDTFFAKGWAPTWNDMGHGNWATDKAYSGKVLKVYADMVAFARTGSV